MALPGGWDTRVYVFSLRAAPPFDGPLVLRAFRPGELRRASWEFTVQAVVAAQGYPAPEPLVSLLEEDAPAGPGFVMRRIPGRELMDAMLSSPRMLLGAPSLLAETHARLHALDAGAIVKGAAERGFTVETQDTVARSLAELEANVERTRLDGLRGLVEWVDAHRPPEPGVPVLCHGDIHPRNVFVDAGRVSGVIDWSNATVGDAALDVATTVLLIRTGTVDLPAPVRAVLAVLRRWLAGRYLSAYRALRPVDAGVLRAYLACVCAWRLWEFGLWRRMAGGAVPGDPLRATHATDRQVMPLIRFARSLTGVRPTLPALGT